MNRKTFSPQLLFFVLSIVIGFFFTPGDKVYAQTNTHSGTPAAFAPGAPAGSYSLSGIENVNLYNGNLNVSLPLLQVGGRGNAGYIMNLPIEHRWQVFKDTSSPGYTFYHQQYEWWSAAKPGYSPGILQARQTAGECEGPGYQTITSTNLTFTNIDGSEIQLRDTIVNGGLQASTCPYNYPANGDTRGTVFVSKDGSHVTFVSDSTIYDQVGSNVLIPYILSPSGYLMFKDGTKYRIDNGLVSKIIDRNGNEVTLTYTSGKVATVTDSLNREITFAYDVNDGSPYGVCDRITYKGTGGVTRIIRISRGSLSSALTTGESLQTLAQLFPNISGDTTNVNPSNLVSSVWLPDGRRYQFFYNSYADVAKIILPTGGKIEYSWWGSDENNAIYRRVSERRVYTDGTNLEGKTVYDAPTYSTPNPIVVRQKKPDGTQLSVQKHYFYGNAWVESQPLDDPAPWTSGREYETESFAADGTTLLRETTQTWEAEPPPYVEGDNPRITETTLRLADTNQISKQTFTYDQFNNVTDTYEYDYGSAAAGNFLRRSHTDYVTDTNYTSATGSHLRSLPSQTWVSPNSNGTNQASLTVFEYDNYTTDSNHAGLTSRSSVSGFDSTNFGTSFTKRGNVTSVTSYSAAANQTGAVSAYSQYDILGNLVKTIDAKGNAATISYADNFGSPDSEATTNSAPSQLSGLSSFASPTSTTNPMNWTAYIQYDYFTGSPVNTQDANGLKSKTIYDDDLDRATQTVSAVGTVNEIQANIDYDDANRTIQSTSDLNTLNDNLIKSVSFYDGLGRTTETRSYEADGDYRTVQTQYDALGRPFKQSNPFRPTEIDTNHPILWSESRFDALGRIYEIETPDGAKVKTAYDGNRILATDQAGKQRISKTNALGQLKDIWEITASDTWTTSVTFPNTSISHGYHTTYNYDILNNLILVDQGDQEREFTYDSLSRLMTAENPESGTISYTYDANGNLTTKRDARNIKTIYDHDVLNRVTKRCYRSIGTGSLGMTTCASNNETLEPNSPEVTYTYDNVTNAKGKLTKVSSSVSTTEYVTFDVLGRVTRSKQTTDGVEYGGGGDEKYWMKYSYNLAGALIEQQYPSSRVIKNILDNEGDLEIVQSKKNANSGYWNYAENFTYNAAGAVTSMQLGNGRWESTVFNNRLQPTQIALGTVSGGYDKLKLNYSYGDWNGGSIDGTKNNGNIVQQVITVPTVGSYTGFTATQKYYYDSLNRIDDATEDISGQTWRQDFSYDRYGNRNFVEANTTTLPKNCGSSPNYTVCSADVPKVNPAVTGSTNKFTTGYTYDSSGNTTEDANEWIYIYDAENKQIEVKDDQNVTVGQYYYDGDGKRVKKYVPDTGETTIFVYDAAGKQIAEYSTIVQTGSNAKIAYTTNDHLGSPRINTDGIGQVIARHDYHPFGEEISTPQRTSGIGYTTDTIRKQFTGYERDNEINLDFAQARYYNPAHGRFTSPDDFRNDTDGSDPQSWNLYIYVRNNPLVFIDPTGEMGDYYDQRNGAYLGNDGINDDKVYVGNGVSATKDKKTGVITTHIENVQQISITHTEFQKRAATIYGESSAPYLAKGQELADEMAGIAYAHKTGNKMAFGASSAQAKTFMNTPLEKRTGKMELANLAIINVETGGRDPSNGADAWDGAEQALFPASDNRASTGAWNLHMNTMGWDITNADYAKWKQNIGSRFKAPQTKIATSNMYGSQGRTRLHSTAVFGRTIFWRTTP